MLLYKYPVCVLAIYVSRGFSPIFARQFECYHLNAVYYLKIE